MQLVAQLKWHDPMKAGFHVMQHQGFAKEIGNTYTRLPNRAKGVVTNDVWHLSQRSSGLAIYFQTNAPELTIRYTVSEKQSKVPQMTMTGESGIDMYRVEKDGRSSFCFGKFSFNDTITYNYKHISGNPLLGEGYEYRLYLPIYNGVRWLEIGVPEGSQLQFLPASTEKPIVLYGTSVSEGACASRPSMSWATLLNRSMELPLINLGFAGNGKLAPEVIKFMCEIDARIYILDCIANLLEKSTEEVTQLITAAVKQIREKHPTPILIMEHFGNSNMDTDEYRAQNVEVLNRGVKIAFEQIQQERISKVYYLSREDINLPTDSWVDYVHPNDYGMKQLSKAVENKLHSILK